MKLRSIVDALGRELTVPVTPRRIVSLVPSVTELLFDLGAGDRVVGCSRYCVEPEAALAAREAEPGRGLVRVGGQKDPDVAAITALAPDLVLAVKEENLARDVGALAARGIAVYVAEVRGVEDALSLVGALCELVDGERGRSEAIRGAIRAGVEEARQHAARHPPLPIFCAVWRDPWITISSDTYMYDVIRLCGGVPRPFERHERRYPKLTLDEVRAARPRLILLPDEPYSFTAADAAELADIAPALIVDGKLLGWYGRRTAGIPRLAKWIGARFDDAARESVLP